MKKFISLSISFFLLVGALPNLAADTGPIPTELEATLSSKFQLIKRRTSQFKAMNRCFFQVSEKVLESEKKGESLTKKNIAQLAESLGLSEACDIAPLLKDLQDDRLIGTRIQYLLELAEKKEQHALDVEFQKLENEVRADLSIAKSQGIDISRFKKDMDEYAKSRIESLMWESIFFNPKHVRR